jgi:hypothetical protein
MSMYRQPKIILVIDNAVSDKDCQFGVNTLENQGFTAEIFRLSGYFTHDPVEDFYRFAAECKVSPQELNSEFQRAKEYGMTSGINGVDIRDITFEEYCWKYVSIVLKRAIGTLKDVGCVVGTNPKAVNYLVDHLRVDANVSGIVVPKSFEVQDTLDLEQKTTFL